MFRKILRGIFFAVAILDFTAFASEESESEAFGSDDEGVDVSPLMVETRVDNPIPTILEETVTNWKASLKLGELKDAFSASLTSLESAYNSSISEFAKMHSEEKSQWDSNLTLLEESVKYLSLTQEEYLENKEAISNLNEKLISVTNNGFFDKVTLALDGEAYKEEVLPILDSTCNLLWDARELIGFIIAINEQSIALTSLPQLCDQIKSGSYAIGRMNSDAKEQTDAVSLKFWKIVDGFGAYDHVEIQSDEQHREKVRSTLGQDSAALLVVMQAFNHECTKS